jgi:hypothetical protein
MASSAGRTVAKASGYHGELPLAALTLPPEIGASRNSTLSLKPSEISSNEARQTEQQESWQDQTNHNVTLLCCDVPLRRHP